MAEKGDFNAEMSGVVSEHPLHTEKVRRPTVEQEAKVFTVQSRPEKTPEELAKIAVIKNNLEQADITKKVSENLTFKQNDSVLKEDVRQNTHEEIIAAAKRKTLVQRVGVALASVGILTGYFGLKGAAADKPKHIDKSTGGNEFVVKPNEVNQNLQDNLRNGNKVEGSTVVTEDSEANKNAQDNLANTDSAGPDTENLE